MSEPTEKAKKKSSKPRKPRGLSISLSSAIHREVTELASVLELKPSAVVSLLAAHVNGNLEGQVVKIYSDALQAKLARASGAGGGN